MKLGLLNTSILTADGEYHMTTIGLEGARVLVLGCELDSAIGHESTAKILSTLLGVEVPVNRQQFVQQPEQVALVFKLNGRPPEGVILSEDEIRAIGFSFKRLVRVS